MQLESYLVKENETLDDLIIGDLKIIQGKESFRFGIDAVILAHFASLRRGDNVIDLGTGSGIIPLLLHTRASDLNIVGLEIQENVAERARRSVLYNDLKNIKIAQGDLRKVAELYPAGSFRRVTSNPPYRPLSSGKLNISEELKVSRHEFACTLGDLTQASSWLLQNKGTFSMIHRAERLAEIFILFKSYSLEIKRLRFVHSFREKEAKLVLIEAVKGGGQGLKVEKPLVLYEGSGSYSTEILELYNKD